jgi:1,4-alpha-glucan branching enzyme
VSTADAGFREGVGDLAIVLHTHMPYVEGFGTYPFGEEWLFDAFARSHLPVLAVARELTMTVTPVLADQLEAAGIEERMRDFLRRHRLEAAERDAAAAALPELRHAAAAEADRYREALERIVGFDGDLLTGFRSARERGVELITSAASHAVMPLLATVAGRRLQIATGLASHRRRFGSTDGFWLPECAYSPGLEDQLAEHGVRFFCVDQTGHEPELAALAPAAARAGLVAFSIDWLSVGRVWSPGGYPSDPIYLEYHRQSITGTRLWAIGGGPYDPEAAGRRAAEHAAAFAAAAAARLERYAAASGRRGLLVFAIDTELLGAWWSEGPEWLANVLELAPERGLRLITLGRALREHQPEPRTLREASWGEGKDLSTWDSPAVTDLAWPPRRLELRLLRALRGRLEERAAARAARELLALQASDWAFLDRRRQAGDYPFQRAVNHSRALLEAIDSPRPPDPRMRNLAPDLRLAPLLEP